MILPDRMIKFHGNRNEIVSPYKEENVQPSSIDLTLADKILIEKVSDRIIDVEEDSIEYTPVSLESYPLKPGDFILASTKEKVNIPDYLCGLIAGRSSIGRLGIEIHQTAGFIDPGFQGKITLEIVNNSRNTIRLKEGMRIAQLILYKMEESCENSYSGKYQNAGEAEGSKLIEDYQEPVDNIVDNLKIRTPEVETDVSGGFERDVGSSCEDGICPVR